MQFRVKSEGKQDMVDITEQVNNAVKESGVEEGICNVFALHTTAATVINENWDENIPDDCFKAWNKAIPPNAGYQHDSVDGNAQSHILAATLGPGETIPIRDGELKLGRWQSVMLVELDGPRTRNVEVTIIPE